MITLNSAVAGEHRSDLLRDAAQVRLASRATNSDSSRADAGVTLRLAEATDGVAVHRLEVLDESTPLAGRILLATRDSDVIAALSLTDGQVAANPFVPTADAVALLRLRAEHIDGPARPPRRRWRTARVRWA